MLEVSRGKRTFDFREGNNDKFTNPYWSKRIRNIEENGVTPSRHLGNRDNMYSNLYSNMSPVYSWDPATTVNHTAHGAVFNLEFSPDGSLLVAACEKRSILVLDSLTGSLVNHVNDAHNACVNCVRFLDSRIFATCSDDNTVSIWDLRYLKNKIRSLKGHSNWVKNIEYAQDVGLLVTASFDGTIYTWDINKYSETDIPFKRVLHTEGLMRAKLSPDFSKLVICTSHGCIMVIHDLNLSTLGTDLRSFQPTIYRLMQTTNAPIHLACKYNHLFTAKRNRVELITDFPKGNEADVISSLQIHPQSWSVVSRNTSIDDTSEWSCMHDLHSYPINPDDIPDTEPWDQSDMVTEEHNHIQTGSSEGTSNAEARPLVHIRFNYRPRTSTSPEEGAREGGRSESSEGGGGASSSSSSSTSSGASSVGMTFRLPVDSFEIFEALAATLAAAHRNRRANEQQAAAAAAAGGTVSSQSSETGEGSSGLAEDGKEKKRRKIVKNRARMTHFMMEPNVGKGFIKELCFSTDGRLVCSPFDHGVRLLSFSDKCAELCDCVPEKPTQFHVVASSTSHPKVVVCTKFAPNHCLLVSGCLGGKICFHQPNF